MKIVVGSLNQTKIKAVQAVFKEADVLAKAVPSGVRRQPIGDEETLQGAINRARYSIENYPYDIGIGLEGGVLFLGEGLYLCNWGALIMSNGKVFTAGGARILLPNEFKTRIENGVELSDVMDEYTKKKGIRHHEGAIGIFTNRRVLRHEMFTHIVTLLKGQMEYNHKL